MNHFSIPNFAYECQPGEETVVQKFFAFILIFVLCASVNCLKVISSILLTHVTDFKHLLVRGEF